MSNPSYKKGKSIKNILGIGKNKKQGINFKNSDELERDYIEIIEKIKDKNSSTILDQIAGKDIKYFIEYNHLDYKIFKLAIKHRREIMLYELDDAKYNYNKNTFLIELYEFIQRNNMKQQQSNSNEEFFNDEDFFFIIGFENGKLMDIEKCKLEFYYLLLSKKYDMAMQILKYEYSNKLKEELNEVLIDIQDNYLKKLLISQDLAYDCLKLALERNMDGIAYEIMTNANLFLDETILELAVLNDCELFLEESWENNLKFGNVHNYFAPKIPFVRYMEVMINNKKFFMASEAIKHWSDTYKQENIFELLVSKECEELAADMIERAAEINFKIEFSNELFLDPIIKKMYFLLKYNINKIRAIIGKPMYKKYLTNEDIQQSLVDPLR